MKIGRDTNMRIAICDDDKADLHALQKAVSIFDQCGTLDICAFSSAAELYKSEMAKNFDIAILDIEMPSLSGLEIAKKLRAANQPLKIIILTTFARKKYFQEALAAKVNGYLLKDSPSDSLISAIYAILEGNTVFDSKLVSGILNEVPNPLTKRELEVLRALKTKATTKELAASLYLSEGTVRNYISAILSKTGTKSRLDAVNLAQAKGWL